MRRRAAAAIFLLLSASAAIAGDFDGGGRVGDYLRWVASANAAGARVEITGVCASACTVKLGARGACVHADARLLFHAARDLDGGLDRLSALMMLQEYPRRVRAWAKSRGALDSESFTAMTGAEAISLGVPDCDRRRGR